MAILSGWKDIATYMKRGVRTVQRWEHLGLPVRRPHERLRSAVVADTEELDAWLHHAPARDSTELTYLRSRVAELEAEVADLHAKLGDRGPLRTTVVVMKSARELQAGSSETRESVR